MEDVSEVGKEEFLGEDVLGLVWSLLSSADLKIHTHQLLTEQTGRATEDTGAMSICTLPVCCRTVWASCVSHCSSVLCNSSSLSSVRSPCLLISHSTSRASGRERKRERERSCMCVCDILLTVKRSSRPLRSLSLSRNLILVTFLSYIF